MKIGIISQNSVCNEFLNDIMIHGIDLYYEEYLNDLKEQGLTDDEIEKECDRYMPDCHLMIYGDWTTNENGQYIPDETGSHGFSVEYNTDSGNLAVFYSKNVAKCYITSPCYRQLDGSPCGDLDTNGDYEAYTLPDDCLAKSCACCGTYR